jgi:two-component system chemotaxis response regulator CheY
MTTLAVLDVLIVDDHEAMRTLLARVLAKAGVTNIRTAPNAGEALAQLAERAASLILADRNLPGMNGVEIITAVRASPAFSHAKIIMISGHTSDEHAQEARAAGADAVLVKPVSPRDLLAAIEALFAV